MEVVKQVAYCKMDDLHRVCLGKFSGYEPMECVSFFSLGKDSYKIIIGDQPGALYRCRLDSNRTAAIPKDLLLDLGVPKELLEPKPAKPANEVGVLSRSFGWGRPLTVWRNYKRIFMALWIQT